MTLRDRTWLKKKRDRKKKRKKKKVSVLVWAADEKGNVSAGGIRGTIVEENSGKGSGEKEGE